MIDSFVARIVRARSQIARDRALLVGVSGIDGSGKGFVSSRMQDALQRQAISTALISADDWLDLSHVWTEANDPAQQFYQHGVRFEEMFPRLVLPLRNARAVDLVADCGDAKATEHRKHHYSFKEIDVVLLEGIFLFRTPYHQHFDLKIWIDCSFETALHRAIARAQEGLPPSETRQAYERIYFPAQQIHFSRDNPRDRADLVLLNDDSLPEGGSARQEATVKGPESRLQ